KLDVRIRKREKLPEGSEYLLPKYDAAFTSTLMSDDEDELDVHGGKTGRFISRCPAWRSETMRNLLDTVDQVADPKPATKYTPRVSGPVKEEPPPIATTLKNRARRWMVSPEWLQRDGNKEFDIPSRIAESGRAWGDAEDPETLEEKKRKLKEEKDEIKQKKACVGGSDAMDKSKSKGPGKGKGKALQQVETTADEDSDAMIDPRLRRGTATSDTDAEAW
ncbi:hypothetical protein NEOLEDRAFT_1055552, partial [Neolentinus lepideus HHB14362 ss-1]